MIANIYKAHLEEWKDRADHHRGEAIKAQRMVKAYEKELKRFKVLEDGFVWRILTPTEAKGFFGIVFILHDDGSESLIETKEELERYILDGAELGIEIGFI